MRTRRLVAAVVVAGVACVATYPTLSTTSTSQASVVLSTMMLDFGMVPLGTPSTLPVTISPQGMSDDTITAIELTSMCNDFVINALVPFVPQRVYSMCTPVGSGSVGVAGGCVPFTYTFGVTFTPTSAPAQQCGVRITYEPTGMPGLNNYLFVTLSGAGLAPPYRLEATPTAIDFGDVPVVGPPSAPQNVTIKNAGSQPLTVSGAISGTAFQTTASLAPKTLLPGLEETYPITCDPASTGLFNETITFTTVEPTQPISVSLACNGLLTSLTADPAIFDPALVGSPPPDVTVRITNTGSPVTVSNIRLANGTSAEVTLAPPLPPSSIPLALNGFVDVTLHYSAATTRVAGPLGTLVFTGGTQDQNVPIRGEAQVGSLGTTPPAVDFGPLCAGPPVTRNVKIYANAPGAVNVSSLTPPLSSAFSVPDVSGGLLGGHGSELTATATLDTTTPGTFEDKFVINSNVPNQRMQEVALRALVLADGIRPTPELVHFGAVMTGLTTIAKEVVLSNCGSGPLMVMSATIGGPDAAEFTIVGPAVVTRVLAAAESMTFLVVMSPDTNGPKSAQLLVTHSQGTTSSELAGDGYGGAEPGNKERETYYACGVGSAAPAWPIAFALLALRRRRR